MLCIPQPSIKQDTKESYHRLGGNRLKIEPDPQITIGAATAAKVHGDGLRRSEAETILLRSPFQAGHSQLQLACNMASTRRSITDSQVVDEEGPSNRRREYISNIIDRDSKQGNTKNSTVWNSTLLSKTAGKVVSRPDTKAAT